MCIREIMYYEVLKVKCHLKTWFIFRLKYDRINATMERNHPRNSFIPNTK